MSDPLAAWLDGFVRDPSFLAKYPYYAAVLAKLVPVVDPSVETMAVSFEGGRVYLHVHVDHFVRAPQDVRGILLPEVHHVVLGHLTHPKFFGVEHPALMEIAQEVSANEFVEEPLPDPITWRTFEHLGVRAGQSTMERYERLVGAHAEGKPIVRAGARARGAERIPIEDLHFVDGHPWSDARTPGGPASKVPPGGVEQTRQLLEHAIREGSEAAQRAGTTRPLLAGKLPGRIVEELIGTLDAPEVFVDWRRALRDFVARARAPVHTWARPSRRFPGRVGEVPGRIWAPRPILRPHLLVAIDTSMSMGDRELSEIARQLVPMSELARLTVVQCDVEIAAVHPFDGRLPSVKGRGGTDLRPVFDPGFLGQQRPDGIVYFTDGQGPWPDAPPHIPVLWILTKPFEFGCPWGDRAKPDLARR